MSLWYSKKAPDFETKNSKSVLHPFTVMGYKGHTLNLYQGCHHRCGYCYATYVWSPEFYDKIYAKSNAPEILENQLKAWKSKAIEPVMISSATDAYQPAELKFELTRKCVKVLQRYGIPYYVFTKSTLISRDMDLHKQYKDNCFVVWSITTCSESIRRIIEPGTPPASAMFEVIKKFSDSGIRCAINIDPIIPLVTDSPKDIESILDNGLKAGVHYVFGSTLRLRADIWERMKIIFELLGIERNNRVKEYGRLYHFVEPLRQGHNLAVDKHYSNTTLENLREAATSRGMSFGFPHLIVKSMHLKTKKLHSDAKKNQPTLMDFI
ncbi:MAG: radical SAM protein [Thermoproteota archaeon]|nr:radical SAM protein [Thermoproteota archaeon]